MQNLLQVGLFLHIVGMATLAGVTLASYITSRQFRFQYIQDKQKGVTIIQLISKLRVVAGIGLLVLIISGLMMMAATHGLYGQQLWFKIKMIFVLLIIAGSIFLRRRMENRLRNWVLDETPNENKAGQIAGLTGKVTYLQLFLLSFFIIIFILSAFRFN